MFRGTLRTGFSLLRPVGLVGRHTQEEAPQAQVGVVTEPLENVCYLCCHSRNDFIPPVKTGIKSTEKSPAGHCLTGAFYIGINGQDLGTRG